MVTGNRYILDGIGNSRSAGSQSKGSSTALKGSYPLSKTSEVGFISLVYMFPPSVRANLPAA